jgi:hypothetical protein
MFRKKNEEGFSDEDLYESIVSNRMIAYRILTEKLNMPESKAAEFINESIKMSKEEIKRRYNKNK